MTDDFSDVAAQLAKLTEADWAVVLIGSAARGRRGFRGMVCSLWSDASGSWRVGTSKSDLRKRLAPLGDKGGSRY